MNKPSLKDQIKHAIHMTGKSVTDVAAMLKLTPMTIYSWISTPQRHKPPQYAAMAIHAARLNLSPVSDDECGLAWADIGVDKQTVRYWSRNDAFPYSAKLAVAWVDHKNKEIRHGLPVSNNRLVEDTNI